MLAPSLGDVLSGESTGVCFVNLESNCDVSSSLLCNKQQVLTDYIMHNYVHTNILLFKKLYQTSWLSLVRDAVIKIIIRDVPTSR